MPARWEHDECGSGIGSAAEHVGDVDELLSAMRGATWVAEEPEVHLLSHPARKRARHPRRGPCSTPTRRDPVSRCICRARRWSVAARAAP